MPWHQLHDYWLSKHDRGRAPSRADLDPVRDIPALVPHLLLIDVLPEGYRVRLQGSEIVSRSGADMTGRMIDQTLYEGPYLAKWLDILMTVGEEQRPLLIRSWLDRRAQAEAIVLVLPLAGAGGQTEMLMMGVFYEGDFGDLPVTGALIPIDMPHAKRAAS